LIRELFERASRQRSIKFLVSRKFARDRLGRGESASECRESAGERESRAVVDRETANVSRTFGEMETTMGK